MWVTRIFLALALFAAGCQRISDGDAEAAIAVVKAAIEAKQKERVDALFATIHPQSAFMEAEKRAAEDLFRRYDLDYNVKSAVAEPGDDGSIRVRLTLEISKRFGPDGLRSSRQTGIYTLRRDHGEWKLWATEILTDLPLLPPAR